MASEITDQEQANSPLAHDDQANSNGVAENRGVKRQRTSAAAAAADDDDDDDDKPGRERRKIEIKFIQDKSRRHITFSKRKAGIMKKVRSPSRHVPSCPVPSRRFASLGHPRRASRIAPASCQHKHASRRPQPR